MGWTAPTTRATDFLVTAAVWNAEHVDNFNTAVNHLVVRKPADESITSNTVPQNDDHLILPVGANEVWLVTFFLIATGIGNLSVQWSFPAAATLQSSGVVNDNGGTITALAISSSSSPSSAFGLRAESATIPRFHRLDILYLGGANAGNVTLMWAQATSNATATTIKANSTLWGVKIA